MTDDCAQLIQELRHVVLPWPPVVQDSPLPLKATVEVEEEDIHTMLGTNPSSTGDSGYF